MSVVVLWDIDGTLMRTPGVGVRAFVAAIEEVTGRTWEPQRLDFGGRTDPDIAALLLASVGIDDTALVPAVLAALTREFAALDDELQASVRVMPGVAVALDALGVHGAVQTTVTGNLEAVARQKLAAARLADRLQLELGAFGSDLHADRSALVELSLARVIASGAAVERDQVWVSATRPATWSPPGPPASGACWSRTGTYGYDELSAVGADAVLADLAAVDPFLAALAVG